MEEVLNSKYGTAKIDRGKYYRISSGKEGNNGKYLHRLLFEEFYGEIPDGFIVHHKNGNRFDNCILNLQLMKKSTHDNLKNSTGFYRVDKSKDKNYKIGFRWRYTSWNNGERISVSSNNLLKLKKKVLNKGWEWQISDKDIARIVCDEYGYILEELV